VNGRGRGGQCLARASADSPAAGRPRPPGRVSEWCLGSERTPPSYHRRPKRVRRAECSPSACQPLLLNIPLQSVRRIDAGQRASRPRVHMHPFPWPAATFWSPRVDVEQKGDAKVLQVTLPPQSATPTQLRYRTRKSRPGTEAPLQRERPSIRPAARDQPPRFRPKANPWRHRPERPRSLSRNTCHTLTATIAPQPAQSYCQASDYVTISHAFSAMRMRCPLRQTRQLAGAGTISAAARLGSKLLR
jgi:hypothetical protein